jgi:hypothetical protein
MARLPGLQVTLLAWHERCRSRCRWPRTSIFRTRSSACDAGSRRRRCGGPPGMVWQGETGSWLPPVGFTRGIAARGWAIESLDDPHGPAAAWAGWRLDFRAAALSVVLAAIHRSKRHIQEVAAADEHRCSMTIGEQPVVPDAVEPVRQDVQQEAPHELSIHRRWMLTYGQKYSPKYSKGRGRNLVRRIKYGSVEPLPCHMPDELRLMQGGKVDQTRGPGLRQPL